MVARALPRRAMPEHWRHLSVGLLASCLLLSSGSVKGQELAESRIAQDLEFSVGHSAANPLHQVVGVVLLEGGGIAVGSAALARFASTQATAPSYLPEGALAEAPGSTRRWNGSASTTAGSTRSIITCGDSLGTTGTVSTEAQSLCVHSAASPPRKSRASLRTDPSWWRQPGPARAHLPER